MAVEDTAEAAGGGGGIVPLITSKPRNDRGTRRVLGCGIIRTMLAAAV